MFRCCSFPLAALALPLAAWLALAGSAEGNPPGNGCTEATWLTGAPLAEAREIASPPTPAEQKRYDDWIASARQRGDLAAIKVDYPVDASVFPPEIHPPTILWHDAAGEADRYILEFSFAKGSSGVRTVVAAGPPPEGEIDERCITITNELYRPTPYQASAKSWKPCAGLWDLIKRKSVRDPVRVTILGFRSGSPGTLLSRGALTFRTSSDPVGAMIFYRDVPLMPSATKDGVIKPIDKSAQPLIAWRLKDISRPDSRLLLTGMPTCANCHSFSDDGKTLAMDVDGPDGDKGAYTLVPVRAETVVDNEHVMSWNAFPGKPAGTMTLGFLSRVSPDGRYAVSTVNEMLYVRNFTDYRFSQVFYPTRGILAYYDTKTHEIRAIPGADDPKFVHANAVFTPDGKSLVFMRGRARDPYDAKQPVATFANDPNETPMIFDLYRIPFNEGRGGRAEPIIGASGNGMSHSFPKVSPDGKWIVWVQSRNGMLMRPDSKLWIVPLAGGQPRLMRCNTPTMNSWHSFSPNGRWMVFSSKSNTPYTQMFLTHIDEAGNDSPPILIEGTTAANRAVNIPEFARITYNDLVSISVPAVEHREHFARATSLARDGRREEAITEMQKALEGEGQEWRTNDWKIHDRLSRMLMNQGKTDEALKHIRESLRLNPDNAEMQANLGYILFERGQLDEARKALDTALRLAPHDTKAWANRAAIRLSQGDADGAIEDYGEAIRRDPDNVGALSGRGLARVLRKDSAAALADFERAIALGTKDPTPYFFRGRLKHQNGDRAGALSDLDKAAELAPQGSLQRQEIEAFRRQVLGGGGG